MNAKLVKLESISLGSRSVFIRPKDHWTDIVRVMQNKNPVTSQWHDPVILWMSGGVDAHYSTIEMADLMVEALQEAKKRHERWSREV